MGGDRGRIFDMAFEENPLCTAGTFTIINAAALVLAHLGMDALAVNNPLVLLDPTRPARLQLKQIELTAKLGGP